MKRWLQDRRNRSGEGPSHALDGAIIGDLDGPTATVDRFGRVGSIDGSWWVEWAVGAQDRWRVAHDEVAVRQSRVENAPVYETWMRIPGGDIVARVASANDGLGRALILEFENLSADAVALAVAGRVAGSAAVTVDADAISLDGIEWIRGERPAGGVAVAVGDPWAAVSAGPDASRVEIDGELPSGALVIALPHRQKVQVQVLIDGEFPSRPVTPDEISAGWRTITANRLAIEVPDSDLGEAWDRILPDVVVQAGSADPRAAAEAAVVLDVAQARHFFRPAGKLESVQRVLDVAGLHDEADRARATVVEAAESGSLRGSDAVAALRSLASRDLLAGQESGLVELAGPLAAAAGEARRVQREVLVVRRVLQAAEGAERHGRREAACRQNAQQRHLGR